jgi:hypothetical protein
MGSGLPVAKAGGGRHAQGTTVAELARSYNVSQATNSRL